MGKSLNIRAGKDTRRFGETEIGRENTLVQGNSLCFDLNYTLLSVYYICYFKYKIKIAPGEFDIRCLFSYASTA